MDNNTKDIMRPTIENKFNQLTLMVDGDINNEYYKDIIEDIGLPEFLRNYTDNNEVKFINKNGKTMVKVAYVIFLKKVTISIDYNYFMLTYFGINRTDDAFDVDVLNDLNEIFRELLHIPKNKILSLTWSS